MNRELIKRGRFNFQRVKDGVYLAFDTTDDNAYGGTVFTNDERGRKWRIVDNKGTLITREFRTMTQAAEKVFPVKESATS